MLPLGLDSDRPACARGRSLPNSRRWPAAAFARPWLRNWTSSPVIVVIAGYANDYAGYVTTREEYESQQYEGGHTLFGPWTEAGYRQEFVRLAHALKTGQPVESSATPEDMRSRKIARTHPRRAGRERRRRSQIRRHGRRRERDSTLRGDRVHREFLDRQPGERIPAERSLYGRRAARSRTRPMGSGASRLRLGHDVPLAASPRGGRTQAGGRPAAARVADRSGALTIARPEPFQVTLTWQTDEKTPAGKYRMVHFGRFKNDGQVVRFVATSRPFEIGS